MKYELMLIVDPKQTEKEIQKTLKDVKDSIEEHGFELREEDDWGIRELAYKIKSARKGHYMVMLFTGEPEGMTALKADLRLQTGLIRHMVTKTPDDYVLLRYEQVMLASSKKVNKQAEEIQQKVAGKRKSEVSTEPAINLDEKLKAIADDKDIAL